METTAQKHGRMLKATLQDIRGEGERVFPTRLIRFYGPHKDAAYKVLVWISRLGM